MAKSTSLALPQHVRSKGVQILPADTTTAKTLYTIGAEDARLIALTCVSDDTATVNVQVLISVGGVDYPIGTVAVAAGSGNAGTVNGVDLINSTAIPGLPIDANGKRYLPLEAGAIVKVRAIATITSAKTVSVFGAFEDYA